jgi:DNA mismatch endonuclease, patch repair protein
MTSIRSRAPRASSSLVRRVMRANVGRTTKPERLLRSLLHARGLRFRKDYRPCADIHCSADVVFTKARICIFVDGCFWHGCPTHFKVPATHADWWREKIADNVRRDGLRTEELTNLGWLVIRLWEHELVGAAQQVASVVDVIVQAYHRRISMLV